jgi:hypothetical protein
LLFVSNTFLINLARKISNNIEFEQKPTIDEKAKTTKPGKPRRSGENGGEPGRTGEDQNEPGRTGENRGGRRGPERRFSQKHATDNNTEFAGFARQLNKIMKNIQTRGFQHYFFKCAILCFIYEGLPGTTPEAP